MLNKNLRHPIEDYIFRAKFSSLANRDIVQAYENIIHKPNEDESKSVEARQIIDLKIGVAFSVYQTNKLCEKYPMLKNDTKTVSYGPCQFPTLGFCIERAERIKKFVSEPFWTLNVTIRENVESVIKHELKWSRKRFFQQELCAVIYEQIKSEKKAIVIDVLESIKVQGKPMGLNTVKLLKVASSAFGMSSHLAMKTAESLYLRGYISYPRTESTTYSSNFNFIEILEAHKKHSDWGKYASKLLESGYENPRSGKDAGDHPPITPVKCAEKDNLDDLEWKMYQFITQNFLATISKPAKYKVLRVTFKVGLEYFELKGKQIESMGFLEITPWLKPKKEVDLPEFKVDEQYQIDNMRVQDGKTSPPGYLTESDLISCMEANEIGTDASIPQHIKNIIDRGYVRVDQKKGRALVPTNLGMSLARAYCQIDSELILPSVRAYIEKSCSRIAKGEIEFQKVVDHVISIFKQKFEHFESNFKTVDDIIKKDYVDKYGTENKKKDKDKNPTKDLIGFPEELKSYEHCTVFEIDKSQITEKVYSLHCNNCKKSQLKKVAPKNKRDTNVYLKCSHCKYEIACFKDCTKFEILKTGCDICKNAFIRVNYPVNDSPFPMYANQHTGCMFCDEVFQRIVELPETDYVAADENKDAEENNDDPNSSEPKAQDESTESKPKKAKEGEIIVKKKKKK